LEAEIMHNQGMVPACYGGLATSDPHRSPDVQAKLSGQDVQDTGLKAKITENAGLNVLFYPSGLNLLSFQANSLNFQAKP